MDILLGIVLPLSLAIIMFSLGNGLEVADFTRVAQRKRAFVIGAICQMVVLPLVALGILSVVDMSPELATGVFLLSLCPGGVTSNVLSKLARGDVALSVSLTAVISLISIFTVPMLATWGVLHFMGEDAPEISVTGLALAMFLITTLPVALGVTLRRFARALSLRIERPLSGIALVLFTLVVVGALVADWSTFATNLVVLDKALVPLCIGMLVVSLGLGRLMGLSGSESKTIAIESGIQNATLGIALAALITQSGDTVSPMALPSAVYGILMFFLAAPFILLVRNRWT